MTNSINGIQTRGYFQVNQNPDAYAQKYAKEKGISLDEAKEQLKAQFGDPNEGSKVPYLGPNNQVSIFDNSISEDNAVEFSPYEGNDNAFASSLPPITDFANGHILRSKGPQDGLNNTQNHDPNQRLKQYAEEIGISPEELYKQIEGIGEEVNNLKKFG